MKRTLSICSPTSALIACAVVAAANAVAASSPATGGATVTVDLALDDFMDFGGAQTVADLPGPDGHVTFREAVTAVNNTPGPQTIAFAIPTSEWGIFSSVMPVIEIENMLYVSDDDTTIDFSTQTAFTGDTNPSGNEVGILYMGPPAAIPSIYLAADRCTVRGLDAGWGNNVGNTIWISGNENLIVGCNTNGLSIRGLSGGGHFNVVQGSRFKEGVHVLSGASDNVFIGNTFNWGLRINGDSLYGPCERNRVGGATPAERNVLAGKGYWGEEGFPLGTQLEIRNAVDTLVQGNYVGTTADGMAKHPGSSGTGGIWVALGSTGTVLRDNVVSGIVMVGTDHYQGQRFGVGITINGAATNTTVVGNRVGVAADGVTPIANREGVVVQSDPNGIPTGVQFGGALPAEGNVVAFSETNGVRVVLDANKVKISRNSIHDNGGLGIELVGWNDTGVTPNDPMDADTGANALQNYPVLSVATPSQVAGMLSSTPSSSFELQFFANAVGDASGFGEGAQFVGSTTVNTNARGVTTFTASLAQVVPPGTAISATATDAAGNTSEFSRWVTVTPAFQRPTRR